MNRRFTAGGAPRQRAAALLRRAAGQIAREPAREEPGAGGAPPDLTSTSAMFAWLRAQGPLVAVGPYAKLVTVLGEDGMVLEGRGIA